MALLLWRRAWAAGQECRLAAPAASLPRPSEEDEEDGARWEEDGPLLLAAEGRTSLSVYAGGRIVCKGHPRLGELLQLRLLQAWLGNHPRGCWAAWALVWRANGV